MGILLGQTLSNSNAHQHCFFHYHRGFKMTEWNLSDKMVDTPMFGEIALQKDIKEFIKRLKKWIEEPKFKQLSLLDITEKIDKLAGPKLTEEQTQK